MYILAAILIVLALVAASVAIKGKFETEGGYGRDPQVTTAPNRIAWIAAAVLLILGIIFGIASVVYKQDVGEAKVQTDISGKIIGQTTDAGFHTKLPWATIHTFNIRNQLADFVNSADNKAVENRTGPYITVQDAEGVSSNVSLNLQYSIDAKSVGDIYAKYKTEEAFKSSFVANSVRTVVRQAPNSFDTIDLITKRGDVEKQITTLLEKKWKGSGVHLDNLSLQEIELPQSVRDSYSAAQQAQIEVEKEKANLEAQKVKAQQQVQSAQAQADANDLLNKHPLSDAALKQQQIEALKTAGENGSLIVVPQGSDSVFQLPSKK